MGLSVMAILATIAMPVWKHDAQREKEAELVFRGDARPRADTLPAEARGDAAERPGAARRTRPRKVYKDPITGDDFDIVRQGQQTA